MYSRRIHGNHVLNVESPYSEMPGGQLKLDLLVRAVTCPGVWLCPKGCVTLSIQLSASKFRTKPVPPIFPLMYNTSFKFTKDIDTDEGAQDKNALEDQLHCKLLQWPKKPFEGNPRLLATYIGVLEDLVYSPEIYTHSKVDLLMKPSPIFPGIIAPKIEIERRMTVEGDPDGGTKQFTTGYESIFLRNCYERNIQDVDESQCEQYCKIDSERQKHFWTMNLGHMPRQRCVCHYPKLHKCPSSSR